MTSIKKINTRSFILAALSLAILSCETVIDADLPLHKLAITLNSTIHPDSTIRAYLTENKFILDNKYDFPGITNATVQLYAGAELVGELSEKSGGLYTLDFYPEQGVTYKITAEKSGMDKVEATDMIPASQADFSIKSVVEQSLGEYDRTYELTYTLDDPSGPDYYETKLYRVVEDYSYYDDGDTSYYYPVGERLEEVYYDELGAELNEFEDYSQSELFSDELFDGRNKEIRIAFYHHNGYYDYQGNFDEANDTTQLYMEVRKVSESYYKYKTTRQLQSDVSGNIFAEPAPVYNNVENGFGIFAGYNSKTVEFQIISSQD